MALIRCSDCRGEMSTDAEHCPHCGRRTPMGESRAKGRGYAVGLLLALVFMLVGAIMFISNWDDFMERDLAYWEYFSDERKNGVFLFIFGIAIFFGGFIDVLVFGVKASRLNQQNAAYSSYGYSRYAVIDYEQRDTLHRPAPPQTFNRPAPPQASGYIPAWKRIEMMEKESKQEETLELPQTVGCCAFCGEEMSEKQVFCGTCGRRR